MSEDGFYKPIKADIELTERANYVVSDSDATSPCGLQWSSEASPRCEKEEWGIPFAIGKSSYLSCHTRDKTKTQAEHLHDILEVPIEICKESDYSKYADQIIDILYLPQKTHWETMKWNFDSSIKYMNLILYIPKLDGVSSDTITIPKTAIPILGNTFHELISRTKAWIITEGDSNPICDSIGEGVYKATLQQKSLVTGLKKRLEMTGLVSKYMERVDESIVDRACSRFQLDNTYCEALSGSISPFSNLHIVLKHCCKDRNMFEKLLYCIGVSLRIPTLLLVPRTDHTNKLFGFTVDFLDPYKADKKECTVQFYSIVNKHTELYDVILSKADDFFHRNEDPYTGWNILTMPIFLNDKERVARAFRKAHLAALTDELQIERIFRYSLVYGSKSVIRAVFEDESLSKLILKRYTKIIELTFYKSSNEVFLYNRLMIALRMVDDRGKKRKDYNYLELMETAIQTLISREFFWVAPVNYFKGEEVDHLYAFFPEYIMVWGVLSQRFEVVELFLEYSGIHLQYRSNNVYILSTEKGIYQICNALAISCLLNGMAKLLKNDTSITKKDLDRLHEQSNRFDQIATDLLDHAITTDDCSLRSLFGTPSPFWSNKSALELASIGNSYTFLNHHTIQVYLFHVWRGYDALKQKEGDRVHIPDRMTHSLTHPYTLSSLRVLYLLTNTPRTGFVLHGIFFLFVIICSFVLLAVSSPEGDQGFFNSVQPLEWVLFICLLGYTIGEIGQYLRIVILNFNDAGIRNWRVVLMLSFFNYFQSVWNKIDAIAVTTFIISVIIRLFSLFYPNFPIYIPRLAYGVTAIPIFTRFFQYILVIKAIGPLIYTIYQAFLKMLKFLLVILILSLAFGTLQIALLRPTASISIRFKHLIFTPFFQIFGEYFFDELLADTYGLSEFNATSTPSNDLKGTFWSRSDWILFLGVGIWVLIINVLIINLMIAYFTQIYAKVAANARSIYILQFREIVDEFTYRTIFPPPFNLIMLPIDLVLLCINIFRTQRKKKVVRSELLELVGEKRILSNKVNVYFAVHNEDSFADKFWKSANVKYPYLLV